MVRIEERKYMIRSAMRTHMTKIVKAIQRNIGPPSSMKSRMASKLSTSQSMISPQ
jgi:hypothetical protein